MTAYKYGDHLQTERLYTRFLTREDVPVWAEFFEDKEALAHFPPMAQESNEEKAVWWIERSMTRYRENRFGLQALIHKETGAFIGQCGLLLQEVDGKEEIEVAYDVLKQYRGQGYAPEAAKAFIDYAFQNKLTDSVISIIDVRNTKSQRVAEKNGLTIEKQTKWLDFNVYIYRLHAHR